MTETTPTQQTAGAETTTLSAEPIEQNVPVLRLRLQKPKSSKQVQWTTETVDNEMMNKKKSKCCCIYEKKRNPLAESDSDDDDRDECDHCHGHVEQRVKSRVATAINIEPSSTEQVSSSS